MTNSTTLRKRIGLLAVAAGSTLALGSIVLGGVAHAQPVQSSEQHALHNNTAAVETDCPDATGDYWHFVTSKNDGTYTFNTITLNLGSETYVASGALIIKNGSQTDNVFVQVPSGHTLGDLQLSGSFANITPAGTELFNLSHLCDGTDGGTTTSAPETSAPETSAPETTTPTTDSECEGDSHGGDNHNEDCSPDTSAPETSAPETSAPETSAPETSAPETSAPQTSAPQTSAPQTSTPDTVAPSSSVTPPVVTDPTTTASTVVIGGPVPTNPPTTAKQTVAESSGALPSTGSSQALFLVLGLAMVLGGVIFVIMSRRPDEA
jgi:LPXTG-motif cell wall-anchored protein